MNNKDYTVKIVNGVHELHFPKAPTLGDLLGGSVNHMEQVQQYALKNKVKRVSLVYDDDPFNDMNEEI